MFSLTIVTQSFAGHLGDFNLAAISIVCTIIIGTSFGFLVRLRSVIVDGEDFIAQNITFENSAPQISN
ncbi:hypothetical protein LINGRAHAP2_LOCUS10597 [Linum grandiflorum]